VARFNTPNPGQTIEAEIDIDSGIFFVEDLLYDPPDQLLAYYTLNSIGVSLVQSVSATHQYTSTEVVRMINFRTPVLERFEGDFRIQQEGPLQSILEHRKTLAEPLVQQPYWFPPVNVRFTLSAEGSRIVASNEAKRVDFLPRHLYFNRESRRLYVGFGHYEILQDPASRKWGITRLPLQEQDYFLVLSRNVALQPYFFYHGSVVEFVERGRG